MGQGVNDMGESMDLVGIPWEEEGSGEPVQSKFVIVDYRHSILEQRWPKYYFQVQGPKGVWA